MRLSRLAVLATLALSSAAMFALPAAAQVTVKMWSIDGDNGLYTKLAEDFNASQSEVVIESRLLAFDDLVNEPDEHHRPLRRTSKEKKVV